MEEFACNYALWLLQKQVIATAIIFCILAEPSKKLVFGQRRTLHTPQLYTWEGEWPDSSEEMSIWSTLSWGSCSVETSCLTQYLPHSLENGGLLCGSQCVSSRESWITSWLHGSGSHKKKEPSLFLFKRQIEVREHFLHKLPLICCNSQAAFRDNSSTCWEHFNPHYISYELLVWSRSGLLEACSLILIVINWHIQGS